MQVKSGVVELYCDMKGSCSCPICSFIRFCNLTYPLKVTVDAGRVSVIKMVLSTFWKIVEGSNVWVSRTVLSIVKVTGSGVT